MSVDDGRIHHRSLVTQLFNAGRIRHRVDLRTIHRASRALQVPVVISTRPTAIVLLLVWRTILERMLHPTMCLVFDGHGYPLPPRRALRPFGRLCRRSCFFNRAIIFPFSISSFSRAMINTSLYSEIFGALAVSPGARASEL